MFDVLGIAPTRDSKVIRRAYAAALKQIDQQTQQAAFESLRAAYERALDWARHAQDAQPSVMDVARAPEPVTALDPALTPHSPEPPADTPAPVPPAADFRPQQPKMNVQVRQASGENGRRLARQRARAISQWVQALMQADDQQLASVWTQIDADPALLHLDAAYEMSSALLKALTERPDGRMPLFRAASARYGWGQHESRLPGRDAVAPLVQQVEDERAIWRGHHRDYRKEHERVIRRMQRVAQPSWRKARRNLPHLHRMHNQVPLWLALQLPPGRREVYLDAAMRVPRYALVLAAIRAAVRKWWWVALVAIVLFAFYLERGNRPSDRKVNEPASRYTSTRPLATLKEQWFALTPEATRASGEQVYRIEDPTAPGGGNFQRRLIVPPPAYPFFAELMKQEGTTVISLQIFPSGLVVASVGNPSGNPYLDEAALAAGRLARVEGALPDIVSRVQVPFTFTLTRK